jgi:Tfp pilus assembly protein PilF
LSLLLDALKRAEQEKLARQPAGTEPASVRAIPASASAASLELQPLAGGGAAVPVAANSPRAEASHAAQNVFQAKAGAPAEEPQSNRTVMWATFGAIAVVAMAAAAYVWYSVKSLTPQYAGTRSRAASPMAPGPLPATGASGGFVPSAPGAPPIDLMPPAAPTPPPASAGPAPATGSVAPGAQGMQAQQETPAERIVRQAAAVVPRPPLALERSAETPRRVPADLAAGYQALRQGDFAAARRGYEAALASDPTSVDAHLGMATLAAREANRSAAAEHYRRALDLDPMNGTARAGLAALADFSRPEALEAQLRADLARLPESSALHFTLGNLYASQRQWQPAQAAYYEAHRLDPGSGDIAFNLAVSLDHLGQRRVAAGFYARAIEAARGRAALFDPATAARRIAELE